MDTGTYTTWEQAYADLVQFVHQHDTIVVTPTSLSVPVDVRDEFYEWVETARKQLVRDVLGVRIDEAICLAQRAATRRSEFVARAGLRSFQLASQLEHFFTDPLATLSKPAFSLVLDGLQNATPVAEIEAKAQVEVADFCYELMRNAYEAWVYYTVVLALDPVKFWGVVSNDTVRVTAVETQDIVAAAQITSPERRIPEAVFQTRDGRLFAMKSEAARELDYYGVRIQRQRDNSAGGNTAGLVCHRVLLLYRLQSLDEVAPVVDRQKNWQKPCDLMCEVLEPCEMSVPAYVSTFVQRINAVRSRRPVQVLTYSAEGSFPCGMDEDLTVAPFERRVVGFDESILCEVASLLDEPKEVSNQKEEV